MRRARPRPLEVRCAALRNAVHGRRGVCQESGGRSNAELDESSKIRQCRSRLPSGTNSTRPGRADRRSTRQREAGRRRLWTQPEPSRVPPTLDHQRSTSSSPRSRSRTRNVTCSRADYRKVREHRVVDPNVDPELLLPRVLHGTPFSTDRACSRRYLQDSAESVRVGLLTRTELPDHIRGRCGTEPALGQRAHFRGSAR